MTSIRSILTRAAGVAVAAALVAAAPAAASAKKPSPSKPYQLRKAKFIATFEAKRSVKWNLPFFITTSDCWHRYFMYGSGSETWQVKSQPAKLLIWAGPNPREKLAVIHYGSYDLTDPEKIPGFLASGIVTRDSTYRLGSKAGACGGTDVTDPDGQTGCGTRLPGHIVNLGAMGDDKIRPELLADPARKVPAIEKCFLGTPPGVSERSWQVVPGKLSVADIFNTKKGTLTSSGTKTWSDVKTMNPGNGKLSSTATLTWTLKLTRVA